MYSGWLIINKAIGFSSAKVVAIVKRILGANKVGHAGTLDPFATGVLPIAVGEATKTSSFLIEAAKKYEFILKFGSQTSTDDIEGEIIAISYNIPTEEKILSVIKQFLGDIEQVPPIYSAIKMQGQPAYARARKGEFFEMKVRKVFIEDLRLLSFENDEAKFSVACGSGTYVRALGRDIAIAANSVGHLTQLQRTSVANFEISNSIDLDFLRNADSAETKSKIFPLSTVLEHFHRIDVSNEVAQRIIYGQKIRMEIENSDTITVWNNENLIAIATIENYICKTLRVFNSCGV